jgi:hypothetical protein
VRLVVTPERIESVEPNETIISFVRPDAQVFGTSATNRAFKAKYSQPGSTASVCGCRRRRRFLFHDCGSGRTMELGRSARTIMRLLVRPLLS